MSRHLPIVITLLFALAQPVSASEDAYSQIYSTCMDASGGVTQDMVECSASETKLHDARLNKAYKAAMTELSDELKTQLRDTQRLWIKYRDANCGLLGSLSGGSIDRINAASCFLDMTKQRADDLEALIGTDI